MGSNPLSAEELRQLYLPRIAMRFPLKSFAGRGAAAHLAVIEDATKLYARCGGQFDATTPIVEPK